MFRFFHSVWPINFRIHFLYASDSRRGAPVCVFAMCGCVRAGPPIGRFWSVLGVPRGCHEGLANQLLEMLSALGAKMAQSGLQSASKRPRRPIWKDSGSILDDFSSIFGRFVSQRLPTLLPFLLRPLDATTQGTVAGSPSGNWIIHIYIYTRNRCS